MWTAIIINHSTAFYMLKKVKYSHFIFPSKDVLFSLLDMRLNKNPQVFIWVSSCDSHVYKVGAAGDCSRAFCFEASAFLLKVWKTVILASHQSFSEGYMSPDETFTFKTHVWSHVTKSPSQTYFNRRGILEKDVIILECSLFTLNAAIAGLLLSIHSIDTMTINTENTSLLHSL